MARSFATLAGSTRSAARRAASLSRSFRISKMSCTSSCEKARKNLADLHGELIVLLRSIYDLSTEEAFSIVSEQLGHPLPPLDAIENEDWGRDYVLQYFLRHTTEELAALGLTLDASS